jgi:hypothetical protein
MKSAALVSQSGVSASVSPVEIIEIMIRPPRKKR